MEAIPQALTLFPETRFVFVGRTMVEKDAYYQAELKTRLAGWGLEHAVIWTGFRHDVERIMMACDVIVHASVQPEPLGVVIMEGMAARKPVVCSMGGGTEEMIQNNVTGLVTPPNDPGALANAITRLLGNAALRAQMGTKGRQLVEDRFTHEHRVRAFVTVFRKIVDNGRA